MKIISRDHIVNGEKIFSLMDSRGLPLMAIKEELRNRGMGFDVPEFVKAALKSKNFTLESIKRKLLEDSSLEERESIKKFFKGKNEVKSTAS